MSVEFDDLDAVQTADLVRSGQVAPGEPALAALQRIAHTNPKLNAVVEHFGEHVHAQIQLLASSEDQRMQKGLLAGVPFLLKDTIEYPGFLFTEGSHFHAKRIGKIAPPWVQAMQRQGAIFIGKTNTPEFGLMDVTENTLHGPCLNPWDTRVASGGSSGGAASAVAARMAPIAHASDGGGSIRVPASNCGVFGFKPTRGSTTEPYPTFDPRIYRGTVRHVITRSVQDSALAYAIAHADLKQASFDLSSHWVRTPLARPLRIGVLGQPMHQGIVDKEHLAALESTQKLLESLGHQLIPVSWPFDSSAQHISFIDRWAYSMFAAVKNMPAVEKALLLNSVEPFTLGLIDQGSKMSAQRVEALVQDAMALERSMDALMTTMDVLLHPVNAVFAVPLGHHSPKLNYHTVMARISRNVAFAYVHNISGHPAMSVPLFWSEADLPVGSHFSAAKHQDELLLQLAYQLELARPWADKRPPISSKFSKGNPKP
jgi:amidase